MQFKRSLGKENLQCKILHWFVYKYILCFVLNQFDQVSQNKLTL